VCNIAFNKETVADVWDELEALGRRHFYEVDGHGADEPNRPYKLSRKLLDAAERVGVLHIYTARVDGQLGAYCLWNVGEDAESEGLLIADMGPWYVAPEHRRLLLGAKVLKFSIKELKVKGVKNLYLHHRLHGRGCGAGILFDRLGAKEIKREFSLWIGD